MDDIIRQTFDAYAKIQPRDLRDTEVHMSTETKDALISSLPTSTHRGFQLLGLPTRIDDNLPLGVVNFVTETEMDRVIRRAAREGRTVNVMMPFDFLPPEPLPAPKPTLKALLKHWWKKCSR
jgi:hypothetical protein